MKRLFRFFLIFLLLLPLLTPPAARGVDCKDPSKIFSSTYDITFSVDDSGAVSVAQKVSLKNLVADCLASEYALTINSTKVRDASGEDSLGKLSVNLSKDSASSVVTAKLKNQVVGKDKIANFTINFVMDNLASKEGGVWSLVAPKITTREKVEAYELKVSVPESFGEVFSVSPIPEGIASAPGRRVLKFGKSVLSQQSVFASFGKEQQIAFSFKVPLENKGLFSQKFFVPLPPDTERQQILIKKFDPEPEKIILDESGNYMALYKVGANKLVEVKVDGVIRIINRQGTFPSPKSFSTQDLENYKKGSDFINVEDKVVRDKVKQFKNTLEAYNFVTNYLDYNFDAVKKGKADRLGAANLLKNKKPSTDLDFVDLFVALSRALGVPSRLVYGVVSVSDGAKPTFVANSLNSETLHVWAQIYDSKEKVWRDVDPTWGKTFIASYYDVAFPDRIALFFSSSGEDVKDLEKFTKLNESIKVWYPSKNDVFSPKADVSLKVDQVLGGFPTEISVTIDNKGAVSLVGAKLDLKAEGLNIIGKKTQELPVIFPFEKRTVTFRVSSNNLLGAKEGKIIAKFEANSGQEKTSITKEEKVTVKSFFSFGLQQAIIVLIILLIILGIFATRYKAKGTS